MKLHDLKCGMKVVFKNGEYGVVESVEPNELLIGPIDRIDCETREDLSNGPDKYDIIEVFDLDDNDVYHSIWKQEEIK